jgi:hypothetical protein
MSIETVEYIKIIKSVMELLNEKGRDKQLTSLLEELMKGHKPGKEYLRAAYNKLLSMTEEDKSLNEIVGLQLGQLRNGLLP